MSGGSDDTFGIPGLARSPDAWLASGTIIGEAYEIKSLLGQGGMSQVYEAYDRYLGRHVAVKLMRLGESAGPDEVSYLRKEARALAAIRHPALVTVHAMGRHGRYEFLVMELIHGITLQALMDQRQATDKSFTVDETVELLIRICEGLVAVHDAGIAHRDVKPSNIMLSTSGRLLLMDLGIFTPQFERPAGMVSGTPQYMAPETIRNQVQAGSWHLVDLYALGVVAWEMLTLSLPFDEEDIIAVLEQHLSHPVPDLGELREDAPPALRRLIHELLAKDPRDRPPAAESVLWRLTAIRKELLSPTRKRQQLSVLIVDDDEDARALLGATVRRVFDTVEIRTAGDSNQALQEARREAPDLILVDLHLPGMSGVDLCMFLRGGRLLAKVPIVSVSGKAEPRDLHALRALGVTHFVPKGAGLPLRLSHTLQSLRASGALGPR